MSLKSAATIATAVVVMVGFVLISPLYFHPAGPETKQAIMLSFSVTELDNSVEWCKNLSSILNQHNLSATVFIVGKVAEENPQTVTVFSDKVDIGSLTYSNVDLTSIDDYTLKLQEVTNGKAAIDKAGNLNSKLFQAPAQATDEDIYSLLSRNGILADFSYNNQYNLYQDEQFIKHEAQTVQAQTYQPETILNQTPTNQPIIIKFDDNNPTSYIASYIESLVTGDFEFVSASELTGLSLTVRGA
ncbi:MAG: polysaccharide deacetylase family protein [Candidatus Bathyarchaeota archaeon]|nr:polysaccharide deacetylase family protein [Candidatus Bathyarchaeota archaeon]